MTGLATHSSSAPRGFEPRANSRSAPTCSHRRGLEERQTTLVNALLERAVDAGGGRAPSTYSRRRAPHRPARPHAAGRTRPSSARSGGARPTRTAPLERAEAGAVTESCDTPALPVRLSPPLKRADAPTPSSAPRIPSRFLVALGATRTDVGRAWGRLERARYERRPHPSRARANPRTRPSAPLATCCIRNANGFLGRCESANVSRLFTRRAFASGAECGAIHLSSPTDGEGR